MAERNIEIKKRKQAGQTAVEYIFLLAVVASVVTSIMGLIRTRYLGDISKCTPTSKQLLCKINTLIMPMGGGKYFQYYPFHK